MAKGNKDASVLFEGAGDKQEDARGFAWPGSDPRPGAGVAGRVTGYKVVKSSYKDKPDFTLCLLDNAVVYEPGVNGGAAELVKVGEVAVMVSAWIVGTLTAVRFAPGALVKVRYVGMQKRAKELEVFTLAPEALKAMHAASRDAEPGEYASASKEPADSGDDLPF